MARAKKYCEADLILLYDLKRHVGNNKSPLLIKWLDCKTELNAGEQYIFDFILKNAQEKIDGWHEEELKMKFISFVLHLGHLVDNPVYNTYFERTVESTVEEHYLKIKTDFMIAKGILDKPQNPYFHFQEWKKHRDPTGDPVAQLLEAFLIAQEINQNDNPIYGCTVTGKYWEFFIMSGKNYFISKSYDCTESDDLMKIIAVLRKFNHILETKLLKAGA
ncbi:MAG: hypothetical protein GQ569_04195 [Methylococcaceae bacterium]|nr:hypothetical protein [Methylococcaceae bacterium]